MSAGYGTCYSALLRGSAWAWNFPCADECPMHKLQVFPYNQDNGYHKLLGFSIYPCCSRKELWFPWARALCRGWCGLWFLQGTFLYFAPVHEKKPLSKATHPFLWVAFQSNSSPWQWSEGLVHKGLCQPSDPSRATLPLASPILPPSLMLSPFGSLVSSLLSGGSISLSWLFSVAWSLGTQGVSLWSPWHTAPGKLPWL